MPWMSVALVIAAYLVGSIPSGLIIGRAVRGVDLRDHGSGRTGATNALRTLGPAFAVLVLLFDIAKGAVPVIAARLIGADTTVEVVAAFAAVVGHNWPLYAGFKGGRGVATSLGAIAAMVPFVGVQVVLVGTIVVVASRYVSLGSVVGAAIAPLVLAPWVYFHHQPVVYLIFALVGAGLVIVQHRDNIGRLQAGTERRIGETAKTPSRSFAEGS